MKGIVPGQRRFSLRDWKKLVKYLCIGAFIIAGLLSVIATDTGDNGGTTTTTDTGSVEGSGK